MAHYPSHALTAIIVILVCVVSHPTLAVDLGKCFADFKNGTLGEQGGVDIHGHPVSLPEAVGITYEFCIANCGRGPENFSWPESSQKFSAWLLPWLALISQLPFGAKYAKDNLMSVVLAVGCPTLAAYSLALTVLNGRWAARRFRGISYPNVQYAFRIMNSLQQAPLKVTQSGSLLASLVLLPENDEWWRDLAYRLEYSSTWTISAATSVAWVFIAYLFTVIDAFTTLEPHPSPDGLSDGQAVGSLWLWLLAVVFGWLRLSPQCDSLGDAITRSNALAFVATPKGTLRAETISKARAIAMRESNDAIYRDEQRTAPIFNYARFLPWTQDVEDVAAAFRSASRRAGLEQPVDNTSGHYGWRHGDIHLEIHPHNRRGSMEQLMAYCAPPSDFRRSHWGPGVLSRFLIATVVAFFLQWGTAISAVIIVYFTPTVGLGCRSLSYLLYAALSTWAWMLLVTSSFLTHYYSSHHRLSSHKSCPRTGLLSGIRKLAIWLRRLGKLVAALNMVVIIAACTLQFGNVYNECYCNSSVVGLRSRAYDIVVINASELKAPWLGGVSLACACGCFFVAFVSLLSGPTLG